MTFILSLILSMFANDKSLMIENAIVTFLPENIVIIEEPEITEYDNNGDIIASIAGESYGFVIDENDISIGLAEWSGDVEIHSNADGMHLVMIDEDSTSTYSLSELEIDNSKSCKIGCPLDAPRYYCNIGPCPPGYTHICYCKKQVPMCRCIKVEIWYEEND